MSNYKIYLTQPNGNYAELDTERVDISTIFSASELADISLRKDTISKTITLKGTKNNNRIFGDLFNLNRSTDIENPEKLFFNYSPLIPVDCAVYDNLSLLYKGNLRVLSISKDSNGVLIYEVVITGYLIDFYGKLGDLLLENLDFSYLSHRYKNSNYEASWIAPVGKGYVYPFIDYGDKSSPYGGDENKIHYTNLRPAIYVREMLNAIFKQPILNGFSYELKGTPDFINDFDRLIIPSDAERLSSDFSGAYGFTATKTGTTDGIINARVKSGLNLTKVVPFDVVTNDLGLVTVSNFVGENNNLFRWNRNVQGDASITVNVSVGHGENPNKMKCYLRLGERDYIDPSNGNADNPDSFTIIQEKLFADVVQNTLLPPTDVTLNIPNTSFVSGKQFAIIIFIMGDGNRFTSSTMTFKIGNARLNLPSVPTNKISYDVVINDLITPVAPVGIKQKDFIKSLMTLFNLYAYTDNENPKRIIFERFVDYYSLAAPALLKSTALDFTDKIDYSKAFRIQTYNEIAKRYSFNYKDDGDYFNDTLYKKRYGVTYGSYIAEDALGEADEKKIDVIFSSTPLVKYNSTNRLHPAIYKLENNIRTPIKSNIRIMYYNGLKACEGYQLGTMSVNGTTYTFEPLIPIPLTTSPTYTSYAQAGHLRFNDGLNNLTYKSDLNFGICREYFGGMDASIFTTPNSFSLNYKKQLTDLGNPDNAIVECSVWLNDVDVSNLDLKTPVFIDTPNGNAYFKIITLEYASSEIPSIVKLQKINF